jgi:hypothetical protein
MKWIIADNQWINAERIDTIIFHQNEISIKTTTTTVTVITDKTDIIKEELWEFFSTRHSDWTIFNMADYK